MAWTAGDAMPATWTFRGAKTQRAAAVIWQLLLDQPAGFTVRDLMARGFNRIQAKDVLRTLRERKLLCEVGTSRATGGAGGRPAKIWGHATNA